MTTSTFERLEMLAMAMPEAERVDIEAWDGEPTFRVRNKNFVFASSDGSGFTAKLPKDEATAVCESDPLVVPTGYGLGRHGWVSVDIEPDTSEERWQQIAEWVHTSFTLVAPKKLAALVDPAEGAP